MKTEPASDKPAIGAVKAEAPADTAPLPASEAKAPYAVIYASAVESRRSFIYGMISGPLVFTFGGFVFLFMQWRRQAAATQLPAMNSVDLERLAVAVVAELKRRDKGVTEAAQPSPARAEPKPEQAAVH